MRGRPLCPAARRSPSLARLALHVLMAGAPLPSLARADATVPSDKRPAEGKRGDAIPPIVVEPRPYVGRISPPPPGGMPPPHLPDPPPPEKPKGKRK